ncbi:hypothetical protein [Bradyrhizobium sp. WSM1417]|uniref:hypothetical protein n=1 Tax=Bradyrhizobium sp. WSM1417 TaxID=754500 RepID=UPI0012EC69E5|nr:hypothetical protein [Bradyrhizobium sp. WSM1417]
MSKRTKDRKLKSSTALSKSSEEDVKPVDLNIEAPKVASAEVETVDPLIEVANIPEQVAAEGSHEVVSTETQTLVSFPRDVPEAFAIGSAFPWSQQKQLLEMAERNTRFLWHFVGLFAGAKSPQDLLAITAEFFREGGVLFKEQSETLLELYVASPSKINPPTA